MSDLTEKFAALEEQLAAQATTMGGYVDTVEAKLQAVLDNLDTIIVNNAANTRALLNALSASSACLPCPTPPLTVPPIVPGDTGVDDEKCQRTQAFLHAMEQIYTTADVISGFGVGWSPSLLTDAITQVIDGFDTGDTPDVPSWPEANQIVNYAIEYGINNFLVGDTLSALFATAKDGALASIYSAATIAADKAAYEASLATAGIPDYAINLMAALAYSGIYNYYFDPASTPNLSSFDGNICVPEECMELSSTLTTYPGPVQGQAIWWTGDFNGSNCTPASYCADGPAWLDENRVGWTITMHGEADVFHNWNFASTHLTDGQSLTLPDTSFMTIQNYPSTTPFSITFCPPEA